MGGKENMDKIWPLTGREAPKFIPPTKEWWDSMRAAQKKVDEQIKKERNV